MAKSVLVLCMVLAACLAVPVPNGEHGLNAALSSIAHSVVIVSDDTPQPHENSSVQADEPPVQLQSANALPSLALIALTPEAHNVLAETETLVYANETDSKGVIKITIVTATSIIDEESTTESTTIQDEEETATTESDDEVTTEELTTPKTTPAAPQLTVIGKDQLEKQKEEEIKENIKEVEAMPVILTFGV